MENKINIAELLKDCPKGMELYSPLCGECEFVKVHDYESRIIVELEDGATVSFQTDGRYYDYPNAECMLFPSKGKTTWEGFVPPCEFKAGDIIKHKDSGLYCTLGEYAEGISAYRTDIGLSLTHKDMEQWELVLNKFDISTLVPFESRVLVRSGDRDRWKPAIFGGCAKNRYNEIEYCYALGGTCWSNCIPYEGNQHLLGTTNDCDEYYKNW